MLCKALGRELYGNQAHAPLHLVGPLFPFRFYPTLKKTCQILLSVRHVIVLGEAQGHMFYQKLRPTGFYIVIHDTQWVSVRYHGKKSKTKAGVSKNIMPN
jgi:hypothetical protein